MRLRARIAGAALGSAVLLAAFLPASLTAAQGVSARATSAADARAADAADSPAALPGSHWRDSSIQDYRNHLLALTTLVEACAKARDTKTCDPAQVGQDDRVPIAANANPDHRLIRYGWLRVLLSAAQDKDKASQDKDGAGSQDEEKSGQNKGNASQDKVAAQNKGNASQGNDRASQDKAAADQSAKTAKEAITGVTASAVEPTTTELLADAEKRLAFDLAQSDQPVVNPPAHADEREVMKKVLAGRDFRNLQDPTARDKFLEKLRAWLSRILQSISKVVPQSIWVGRVVFWGFVFAVCVGLVWGLLQLERRWRTRLVPTGDGPAAGAASARDWQLWLEDARLAAAAGLWREAIHYLYWASISRLESRRLWPADRARTPREYLALVAAEDPRKPGLATLTRSFERFWYGGRSAAQSDYLKAEELATALISGPGSVGQ